MGSHEKQMLWDAAVSSCSSVAIAGFMSWKFNIHISCLLQAVILPTNFYDNLCCRKYLTGAKGLLYGELLERPVPPPPKKDTSKYLKPPNAQTGEDAWGPNVAYTSTVYTITVLSHRFHFKFLFEID